MFYLPLGEGRYRPTERTEGAWQPGEQHMAPVSGLIVHVVERYVAEHFADDGLQIARLSFEILGMIRDHDMQIEVDVVRPGRTIQLLEATLTIDERVVIRARVWRLAATETARVAGGAPDRLPGPHDLRQWDNEIGWGGGYIDSLDIRPLPGWAPGRGKSWMHTDVVLVRDEPVTELSRYLALVDTANGVAPRESPREWLFPNVELSIHLYRQPTGPWVGFDTTVVFGAAGLGLTSSVLHDLDGPVGMAQQTLTLRPL
ncbi:thioesterase family protein [soil metagenome]